jgi:hypothetical protein
VLAVRQFTDLREQDLIQQAGAFARESVKTTIAIPFLLLFLL